MVQCQGGERRERHLPAHAAFDSKRKLKWKPRDELRTKQRCSICERIRARPRNCESAVKTGSYTDYVITDKAAAMAALDSIKRKAQTIRSGMTEQGQT